MHVININFLWALILIIMHPTFHSVHPHGRFLLPPISIVYNLHVEFQITSFLRRKQYICYMITSILMGMLLVDIMYSCMHLYHECFFVVTISSSSCQVISSKLPDVESLCPETEIILTCLTRGSPLIIWRSMDYIGGANVIDFNELNTPGEEKRSSVYSSTVATLTNISMDNTERILISQLRITIRSDVASTSVICVHNNGSTDKIVLNLLGMIVHAHRYYFFVPSQIL